MDTFILYAMKPINILWIKNSSTRKFLYSSVLQKIFHEYYDKYRKIDTSKISPGLRPLGGFKTDYIQSLNFSC